MPPQPTPFDNFAVPSESAIASYSYTDMLQSAGYIIYNIFGLFEGEYGSGTSTFHMANNSPYGYARLLGGNSSSTPIVTEIKSSIFTTPQTIKGTAYIDIAYKFVVASGGNGKYAEIDGTLYIKNDTTSKNENLGSFNLYTPVVYNTTKYDVMSSGIEISEINICKGDYLQLDIETSAINYTQYGTSGSIYVCADPTSLDTDQVGTTRIHIPFKINI